MPINTFIILICSPELRLRNFPSIALFHDGGKVDTWKADMDGEVDCSAKDIKKAIEEVSSGDVF